MRSRIVSSTQLPHYLLYGATALFLLMARHRDALVSRWLAYLPALLAIGVLPLLPAVGQWLAGVTDDAYISADARARIGEVHLAKIVRRLGLYDRYCVTIDSHTNQ